MFDQTYHDLKESLHSKVINEIDLESLNRLQEDVAREQLRQVILDVLQREKTPLTMTEREQMVTEILDEVFGLGPLQPLLADPTLSDILVNGAYNVYVERRGKLERTAVRFTDNEHLMRIIDRIVSRVGRRVDESSPMVDARLLDGSRVNVIIPPLALDGPVLSIRRFGTDPLMAQDLLDNGTLTIEMLDLLKASRAGETECNNFRRYRRGQNHTAQCSFRLYSRGRTHRYH